MTATFGAAIGALSSILGTDPSFDYAGSSHKANLGEGNVLFTPDNHRVSPVRLRSELPLKVNEGKALAEFTLHAGETAAFVLEEAIPGQDDPTTISHDLDRR